MTLHELAAHVKEMRDLQTAYFASKKENRWGDKKLLAASKAKEAEVDGLVREVLDAAEMDDTRFETTLGKLTSKGGGEG